jgi:DNA recombination protein RmuC
MDMVSIAIGLAVGVLAGAAIAWLLQGQRIAALSVENAALKDEAADARRAREELENIKGRMEASRRDAEELTELRKRNFDLGRDNASLRTELERSAVAHADQVAQLTALRQDVQMQFKLLASEALKSSSDEFVKRAEELFVKQKDLTAKEIDERSRTIGELIKPLGESLKAYDTALTEIEKQRIEGFSAIDTTLKSVALQHGEVKTVTASLVNALRASPKTRGRWGEETLRRVMELSGMVENCDFETEKFFRGDDESLRPDALISVSGGRVIVVDAKAPVSAYIDAISATSDDEREVLLKRHAVQLRERLANLSSKSYWEKIEGSPDCVVMFVPGDNFVSAAFERDPDLFEDGIKARVLICTPTTFIALTKAISYGWRQERLARNATEVSKLGKELYGRLATLGDHVADLGKHIKNAAQKYNNMVGSLESQVMPQARRFNELGVDGTAEPLKMLAEVDTVIRTPLEDRDLLLTKTGE